MKIIYYLTICLSFLFLFQTPILGRVKFGDCNSTIKLNGDVELILDQNLSVVDGTIKRKNDGQISCSNEQYISFSDAILDSDTSEAFFSGVYDPAGVDTVKLQGSSSTASHRFRAEPGTIVHQLEVSNTYNTLEGQPKFTYDLRIYDGATLNIGIQSKLNKNIDLNYDDGSSGGTLRLIDDLKLHDDVIIQKIGTIDFNDRTLHLPGDESFWTSTLRLYNATDIELHAKTELSGTWTFEAVEGNQNAYLNGNGNILDLSSTGTLWIKPGVTLHLVDVQIKGLASDTANKGTILLEGADSQLRLHNSKIYLSGDYTVTQGGWYVCGDDSSIITGAYTLSFTDGTDSFGTLTVDGVTLWCDSLQTYTWDGGVDLDILIWPTHPFDADNNLGSNLTYLNGGLVKSTQLLGKEGDIRLSYPTNYLNENHDLKPYHRVVFHKLDEAGESAGIKEIILDGRGYNLQFPRDSVDTFLRLEENVTVTLKNIVLKDFCPNCVSIGSGSTLHFGDGVVIELAQNQELTDSTFTMTFASVATGRAIVHGFGNQLRLSRDHGVYVDGNMTLTLQDVLVSGLGGSNQENNLHCSVTSTIDLMKAELALDGTFNFVTGSIRAMYEVKISGTGHTFVYGSSQYLTVVEDTTLQLDKGITFSYDTSSNSRGLIRLPDKSSIFYLNSARLYAVSPGLQLTTGTLMVDGKSYLAGDATSQANGITIGNGISAGNLLIETLPAANLQLESGYVVYNNTY